MPQHDTLELDALTWTLITSNNVTTLRVTNLGTEAIWLQATATAVAPTNADGALPLHPNETLAGDLTLEQLYPGVAGAARVYAMSAVPARVSVSHA